MIKLSMKIGAIASLAMISASFAASALATRQSKDIYPASTMAVDEIKTALTLAKKQHKRVILDFGGNWCGDCRALNTYFHQEPNASMLKKSFILVDVNIGKMDQNVDIAKKYGVPLNKGVPALAVVDADGATLYSQKNGEFESMRRMDPTSVTAFLQQWKG